MGYGVCAWGKAVVELWEGLCGICGGIWEGLWCAGRVREGCGGWRWVEMGGGVIAGLCKAA